MNCFRISSLAVASALAFGAFNAGAAVVTITTTPSPVISIPGLTGFETTGADMSGMSVTATFTNTSQTLTWATTGATSGGVTGAGWGLSLADDSFDTVWVFTLTNNSLGQLTHLTLNGTPGLTIFDRTRPSPGTTGSSSGLDFAIASGCGTCVITANYSGQTAIGSAAPVGDLWQQLDLSFTGGTGPRSNFRFVQDTDNDARYITNAPEPETWALMLGGLGVVGTMVRRRGALRA